MGLNEYIIHNFSVYYRRKTVCCLQISSGYLKVLFGNLRHGKT